MVREAFLEQVDQSEYAPYVLQLEDSFTDQPEFSFGLCQKAFSMEVSFTGVVPFFTRGSWHVPAHSALEAHRPSFVLLCTYTAGAEGENF